MNEFTAALLGMVVIAVVVIVVIVRAPGSVTEFVRGITKVHWGLRGLDVERNAEAAAQRGGDKEGVLHELGRVPVRGRALWVDDQPENNVAEMHLLRGRGVDVDLSATNSGAIELARSAARLGRPYGVVISDIARRNDDGPQGGLALPSLLETSLGVRPPIIFYSGTAEDTGIPNTVSTSIPSELFSAIARVLNR